MNYCEHLSKIQWKKYLSINLSIHFCLFFGPSLWFNEDVIYVTYNVDVCFEFLKFSILCLIVVVQIGCYPQFLRCTILSCNEEEEHVLFHRVYSSIFRLVFLFELVNVSLVIYCVTFITLYVTLVTQSVSLRNFSHSIRIFSVLALS